MQVIKIVCPGCKNAYRLKTANPAALVNKTFNCPKCGFTVQFSMLLKKKDIHAFHHDVPKLHTHIAGNKGCTNGVQSGLKTTVHGNMQVSNCNRTVMIVEKTGNKFPLAPGTYILGRDSLDSKATLRIAPDPYMSRQQARLTVNAIGGKLQCTLCGLTSANPIFVNNKKVASGCQVVLKSGDKVLLGMTTVLFMSN